MDYQHDRHSVPLLVYHLIFCPKRRRHVLVGPVQRRLKQIITEVIAEHECQLIELAIQPDHVHLFDPTLYPTTKRKLRRYPHSHAPKKERPFIPGLKDLILTHI